MLGAYTYRGPTYIVRLDELLNLMSFRPPSPNFKSYIRPWWMYPILVGPLETPCVGGGKLVDGSKWSKVNSSKYNPISITSTGVNVSGVAGSWQERGYGHQGSWREHRGQSPVDERGQHGQGGQPRRYVRVCVPVCVCVHVSGRSLIHV